MKKNANGLSKIITLFIFLLPALASAQPPRELTYEETQIKALGLAREASHWIITEGIKEFNEHDRDDLWLFNNWFNDSLSH